MQELFTKIAYSMAPREVVWFQARRGETLVAVDGRLWVTRVGDHHDYWLMPGERLELQAGERLWVGAEADRAVRIELLRSARRWRQWWGLLPARLGKPPVRVVH